MAEILHNLIIEALSKGYERQYMRIQASARFYDHLNYMRNLVHISNGEENEKRMTMTQFMGIPVEPTTSYFMGEGFMLVYGMRSLNNEIRPIENKMLGIYSTSLGLPIK